MISILMHNKKLIKKILIFAFWILMWQVLYLLVNEPLFLAGPKDTFYSLIGLICSADTYRIILRSMGKMIFGFCISLLAAVMIAFAAWRIVLIREGLTPLLSFFKAVPIASVIILFLAWFTSSGISVFIAGFVAFPILYFEVLASLDRIDAGILEVLRVYKVPFIKRLRYVYWPAVCGQMEQTARIAVGMCIRAGVAAELIGVPMRSIGEKLYKAKLYLDIDDLFAWTFLIVTAGYLCERLLIGVMKIWKGKAGRT